jgi:hypothetical protein
MSVPAYITNNAPVGPRYLTNELGDIDRVDEGGVIKAFDPSLWNWYGPNRSQRDWASIRRRIDSLQGITGFDVAEREGDRYIPGPRTRQSVWGRFAPGAAPPAAQRSLGGEGTRKYFDRLSEAVGMTANDLVTSPERSPMIVYDFVGGREFTVKYTSPGPTAEGHGTVYVLEDGFGIKIGYTSGAVAKRVLDLQTGNSRKITQIADIFNATPEVEALLHRALNEWNVTGEWFARDRVIARAVAAGGFEPLLRELLGVEDWPIHIHPPYR